MNSRDSGEDKQVKTTDREDKKQDSTSIVTIVDHHGVNLMETIIIKN